MTVTKFRMGKITRLDVVEISEPNTPETNTVRFYIDSTTGKVMVKKDDGSTVALEGAGGMASTVPITLIGDTIGLDYGSGLTVSGSSLVLDPTASPTFAGLTINGNIIVTGNVDGVDIAALKTDIDGFPDELKNLVQVEIQQLENIGAETISAAQWGYLGALDQGLTTGSSPTFAGLTVVNAINEFSTDGTLAGDSDSALPSEKAVKTYVDTQVATVNSLAEILALGNETDGTNILLDQGADLIIYSDDKITEVARIDGATGNITTIGTIDGVDIAALKTDVDGFNDELKNLIQVEIQQLENIDAVTISGAQWGYLGALNQGLTTGSTVVFAEVKIPILDSGSDVNLAIQRNNINKIVVADGYTIFADDIRLDAGETIQDSGGNSLLGGDGAGNISVLANLSCNIVFTGTQTVDGVDVSALKTDVDGFNDELKDLVQVEIQQLENIGAVTISNAQWGYLGALDQGLTQASSPTFVGLTLTGVIATPTTITLSGNLIHSTNAGIFRNTTTGGNISLYSTNVWNNGAALALDDDADGFRFYYDGVLIGNLVSSGDFTIAGDLTVSGHNIGLGTAPVAGVAIRTTSTNSVVIKAPYASYYLWYQDDILDTELIMHAWHATYADYMKFHAPSTTTTGPTLWLCRGANYHLMLRSAADVELMTITSAGAMTLASNLTVGGKLGIGKSPAYAIDIVGVNAVDVSSNVERYVNSAYGIAWYMKKARGTEAVPLKAENNDQLFSIGAYGWDGNEFAASSTISFEVDGVTGDDDMPGRIILKTSPDGTKVPIAALTLDSSQNANFVGAITGVTTFSAGTATFEVAADGYITTYPGMVVGADNYVLTYDHVLGTLVLEAASVGAHTHDGDTLQLDGINSNGGAFPFTTTGTVTFNQAVTVQGLLTADGVYPEADISDYLGSSTKTWLGMYCDTRYTRESVAIWNRGSSSYMSTQMRVASDWDPYTFKILDMGASTSYAWDNCYADNWYNISKWKTFTDPMAVLRGFRADKDDQYELDFKHLDDWIKGRMKCKVKDPADISDDKTTKPVWMGSYVLKSDKAKRGAKVVHDERLKKKVKVGNYADGYMDEDFERENAWSINKTLLVAIQAITNLQDEVDTLTARLGELESAA